MLVKIQFGGIKLMQTILEKKAQKFKIVFFPQQNHHKPTY
jgi:hypothetical protein